MIFLNDYSENKIDKDITICWTLTSEKKKIGKKITNGCSFGCTKV